MSRSTPEHLAALERLPDGTRDRVRERAAIIWEATPGMSWEEADAQALALETGRTYQRRLF